MNKFSIAYILAMSLIAFVFFGLDKRKAKKHQNRISENKLLLLTFFGGTIGAILGIIIFNHKIAKRSFLLQIFFITSIHIFLLLSIYNRKIIF